MWKDESISPERRRNGKKTSDERRNRSVEKCKSHSSKSRSRSNSRSRSRSRSQSRSRSRSRRRSETLSHSRSRTRSRSRSHAARSRSSRNDYTHDDRRHIRRDEPDPSKCLGIFGLSLYTTERDLKELFSQYGELESVQLVYDHPTGRSRGFGFVYFKRLEDSSEAKDRTTGTEIDGHKIRVDFSITKRAHTPTPGIYMGAPDSRDRTFPTRSHFRRSKSPRYRSSRYRDSSPRHHRRDCYSPYRDRYRHRSPSTSRYYDDRRRRSRSYDRDREYY